MSCLNFIDNFKYGFSKETIVHTRDANKLLTLDIELSRVCNYSCKYCYSAAGDKLENELSYMELCDVVDQAENLGVRSIVIIGGGEPLLYPRLKDLILYIFEKQINIVLFTNGAFLNKDMSFFLKEHNVFPVLKVNGISPKTINWLCGNTKAYENFINAVSYLQDAGYTNREETFGISTIICRQNYNEIIPLWKWCRNNNLIPYFERLSPQGRALRHNMQVSIKELKDIFNKLSELDREEYDILWDAVHPPIAGSSCNRHYYSLYIKSNGDVIPCSGIDLPVGNIRDKELQQIIIDSNVIQDLRHIDLTIKGKCKHCDNAFWCYGCRGNAYQICGDYLAEDPLCWKVE